MTIHAPTRDIFWCVKSLVHICEIIRPDLTHQKVSQAENNILSLFKGGGGKIHMGFPHLNILKGGTLQFFFWKFFLLDKTEVSAP